MLFLRRSSTEQTSHLGNTRCIKTLSNKVTRATLKELTKHNLTQNTPTIPLGSKPQSVSRMLYCLALCVHDHILGYIREAKTSKEAWGNLKKIFAANSVARKLQLRHKLKNLQQRNMSISSYTLKKIKELRDALRSINVIIDDDEMVQICLASLVPWFGSIRSAILAREKPLSFSISN